MPAPACPPSIARFARTVLPRMHRAARGDEMASLVEILVSSERLNSFGQFAETTRVLRTAYEMAGATAEVWAVPTGGALGSGRWVIQEAADVEGAMVDLLPTPEEEAAGGGSRPLLEWRTNPWHVVQWSTATPPQGVTCELVVIDTPEAFDAVPAEGLRGKMVLTRLPAWDWRARFVEKGAVGLIADPPVPRRPDAVAWVKFGWGGLSLHDAAARLVGLVLSADEGDALRQVVRGRQARGQKAMVWAKVDVRRYAGSHDVVSGVVAGRDDPQAEVWAVAHSCEPGALDNASGVAVCVGIARLLNELIAAGELPRPRRSIRLLNGYECYGFFHQLERQARFETPLAGVCIDTVGARPELCDAALRWHGAVPSSATFVDGVGETFLRAAMYLDDAGYRLEPKPFVSTEDTLLGDPQFGFPCPWVTNHPFVGYHSSADVPELLHPRGLAQVAAAMAAYLYYLADAATLEAVELARWETAKTVAAVRRIGAPAVQQEPAGEPPAAARIHFARVQHAASMRRLQRWLWGGSRPAILEKFAACEAEVGDAAMQSSRARNAGNFSPRADDGAAADAAGSAIGVAGGPAPRSGAAGNPAGAPVQLLDYVPFRRAPLAPTPENLWPPAADVIHRLPKWAAYWADGKRSLADVAALLAVELNRPVAPERVIEFFQTLAAVGYVDLADPAAMNDEPALVRDLHALGVTPGTDLMVHSSLSRIGRVRGGAAAVVRAMLSAVSPGGTLLAPSFNHFRAAVFNPLTTPTTNGAIAEALWRRPDALRSVHPSHAVAAVGPGAERYVADHLENGAWSSDSPIGRLVHRGGYVLALGVSHHTTTAYHVAEISLAAPCLDEFGSADRVVAPDGQVRQVPGLAWRDGACPVDERGIDAELDRRGLLRRGLVGRAASSLVKAIDVWNTRRDLLKAACPACAITPLRRGRNESEDI